MKNLVGMLVASALVTPALAAQTLEEFKPEAESKFLQECIAGRFPDVFHGDPARCSCFVGKLIEPMTLIEAISMSNGIYSASFVQREASAARACLP